MVGRVVEPMVLEGNNAAALLRQFRITLCMQAADHDHVSFNFEPQCVWESFDGTTAIFADNLAVGERTKLDLAYGYFDTVKEFRTEPTALSFLPLSGIVYVALSDSGEEDFQRGWSFSRLRRLFSIAWRASTAAFRSCSNVASRSRRIRFVSSSTAFSGRAGVMLIGIW
jgi:hypothetical protein